MVIFAPKKITKIIREAAATLDVTIVSIFREANVSHRNMERWDKKTFPNRKTENKIIEAINRLSKKSKCNDTHKHADAGVNTV